MPRKNSQSWNVGHAVTATRLNHINSDLDDLYALGSDRLKLYTQAGDTAFQVRIGAGNYRVGDTEGYYGGGVISVGASATTYITIDSTGTINTSTAGWNVTHTKIGIVVSNGSTITSVTQWRNDAVGGLLSGKGIPDMRSVALGTPNTYSNQTMVGPEFRPQAGGDAGRLEIPLMTGIVSWWTLFTYGNWTTWDYTFQIAYSNSTTDGQIYIFMRKAISGTTWGSWSQIKLGGVQMLEQEYLSRMHFTF